jgi:DNA-directed RNA polymerase specialized sigma24 family protein
MGKNYLDNKRFEELIKIVKADPDNKEAENELFTMFDLLISNIFMSFGFSLDEEDAKQDCFVLIIKTLKNFNKDSGTAFNYFTTVILNNFKLLYTKDKKYQQKIDEYTLHITVREQQHNTRNHNYYDDEY